jgi:hypothetical protein
VALDALGAAMTLQSFKFTRTHADAMDEARKRTPV